MAEWARIADKYYINLDRIEFIEVSKDNKEVYLYPGSAIAENSERYTVKDEYAKNLIFFLSNGEDEACY